MGLRSPILAGNPRLEQAALGPPAVKAAPPKDDVDAVQRIQRALDRLGYRAMMPKTFESGDADGAYGQETFNAVLAFQKRVFPGKLKEWDGRVGKNTLAMMDAELLKLKGTPPPAPPPPVDPLSVPGYEHLPRTLLATLRRSYDEKDRVNWNLVNAMGYPPGRTAAEMSFKEVLDELQRQGLLAVMQAVHDRCLRTTGLWEKIHSIRQAWTLSVGHGVSQGFCWTAKTPDQAMSLLRGSPNFCEDLWPMNADHQKYRDGTTQRRTTFREVIGAPGPGLHVCVVVAADRGKDAYGGEHDIHIDAHQIVCRKYRANPYITLQQPDGSCFYVGIADHAKDAIPYFLKKLGLDVKMDQAISGFSRLVQQAGGIDAVRPAAVGEMLKKLVPQLPADLAAQAGEWLLALMRAIDPRQLMR